MNADGAPASRPAVLSASAPGSQDAAEAAPGFLLLADVALQRAVGGQELFTYLVPERLAGKVLAGDLAEVPFGSRVEQGVVIAVRRGAPTPFKLRDISALSEPEPGLPPHLLQLARWIADYYACSFNDALGLMLPPVLGRETITEYRAAPQRPEAETRLSTVQCELLAQLRERGPLTAAGAARGRDLLEVTRALESLVRRKVLVRTVSLGRNVVAESVEQVVVAQPVPRGQHLGARQAAVLEYLASVGGEATVAELREALSVEASLITRLRERKQVLTYNRQVRRDPLAHRNIARLPIPSLTRQQLAACASIQAALRRGETEVFLLHGVTGSGKTEVYLQAVAETLRLGRQAIVLVPEIGLTPQSVERFAGRFPAQIGVMHSRLSPGERLDEWRRMREQRCSVVIGARSALFSPLRNVGLIVLDEEHDPSFKQDRAPRYHARETALKMAELTGAVVVLGSATPDVVSYSRANNGAFTLLPMERRVNEEAVPGSLSAARPTGSGMPTVQVVDMRLELKAGNRSIFSRSLLSGLERIAQRKEQGILFLNRRGYATFVNCRDCGFVVRCGRCDLPFSYHSEGERLLCHRCGAQAPSPKLCPDCGSWRIRFFGLGTQRVEQELSERFPKLRIQRYDKDVVGGRHGHEQILDRFGTGEADVLIGTQLVTKGLDFPRVTLVGVVSADTVLHLPDFRAAERTFQLLAQVAGRAGRADLPGTVLIQTYNPTHFAIRAAAEHNYAAFYHDEMRFRREAVYPPFTRLARLTVSARSEQRCRDEAISLAGRLEAFIKDNGEKDIELIGPAPCFIGKSDNSFFWQIVVRGAAIQRVIEQVPSGWSVDIDPVSML